MTFRILPAGVMVLLLGYGCSSPPTIAVLTDYGWNDPYVGALYGTILSINPAARLTAITHAVPDYDVREASYLLATVANEFPAGTIFLAVVDPDAGGSRRRIIIETQDEKYFVGPDNGVFTDVIKTAGLKRAVEISNVLWYRRGVTSTTFEGRDIFGPAAAHLSKGKKITDAGKQIFDPVQFDRTPASLTESGITGEILHRDHYGNLVTNIQAPMLAKAGWRAGMALECQVKGQVVPATFVERRGAASRGAFILILNHQGFLELARTLDSAGDSLNAGAGEVVLVRTAGAGSPATTTTATVVTPRVSPRATAAK
ncbi:MAG: SAM-dependent chlorinase/fluorinase [candidate division KSB1 bacterium]|nr:SAM-dependent chlorinase/fluorinase [candidate division KSB1 bacterium]MDZ7288279.1 SAM-dependent chlorinase/fluorinase [candidate division KSB1 bacterium]MDZ7300497.1 SAM-dependent chlorinase/fluorinase [candidate division KSB1 bacterium]MDZ7308078.1 SAM-dependent chlorinase/fluorinase [candidate division KSB1 bacterium]MDZ7351495.1 SAM-dependent chlorinase/fluorinase [candidate division KSB1 bacterium]